MKHLDAVVVFTNRDRHTVAPFAGKTPIITIPLGIDIPDKRLTQRVGSPLIYSFLGHLHIDQYRCGKSPCTDSLPPGERTLSGSYCTSLEIIPRNNCGGWRVTRWSLPGSSRRYSFPHVLQSLGSLCAMAEVCASKFWNAAAGKALVATPRALEGLAVTDREQVMVARNDQEFCEAVLYLLSKPGERARLATRTAQWANTTLAWDKSVTAYEALYDRLLG